MARLFIFILSFREFMSNIKFLFYFFLESDAKLINYEVAQTLKSIESSSNATKFDCNEITASQDMLTSSNLC